MSADGGGGGGAGDGRGDDLARDIAESLSVLDENIEILTDIEDDLDEESEEELVADVGLYDLIDMSEDVAKNAQIKRAEREFLKRQHPDDDP